jgi:uncharacterized protein (DUF1778 family)
MTESESRATGTRRLIQLTLEDAEQIMHLLDNPPEPNASLRKAAEANQRLIRRRNCTS